jgi:hypothetical protein
VSLVNALGTKVVKQKADAAIASPSLTMESQKEAPMHTKRYHTDKRLLALAIFFAVAACVAIQYWF